MVDTADDDSNVDREEKQQRFPSHVSRRQFLKLMGVGALGAAAGMTGVNHLTERRKSLQPSTPTGHQTASSISFDNTVNAVNDLGMDPNGNDPIDGALESAMDDGTLIEFPPGEYRYTDQHNVSGISRFGVRGTGTSHRDVVITCPQGARNRFISASGADQLLLENFSFDHHRDRETLIWLLVKGDGCVLKDIEWLGSVPADPPGWNYVVGLEAEGQDDVQLAQNLMTGLDAPAVDITYPNGCQFITGTSGQGEVILRDLKVYRCNSSATRYTQYPGCTTIEGGQYVNNDNANVRFGAGGHPTKKSSCRGAYIEVDGSRKSEDAIRLDSSQNGWSGAVIENTHIRWSNQSGRGVIAIPGWGEHKGATIRNCFVQNDASGTATINADSAGGGDTAVVVEDSHFTGSGGGFNASNRPGSVLRNCCIDMPNASISGFDTENISRSGCESPKEPENIDYESSAGSGASVGSGSGSGTGSGLC